MACGWLAAPKQLAYRWLEGGFARPLPWHDDRLHLRELAKGGELPYEDRNVRWSSEFRLGRQQVPAILAVCDCRIGVLDDSV